MAKPYQELYVTRVDLPCCRERHTVTLGCYEDEAPWLLIAHGEACIYDSRTSKDKLGYNPMIPHETHQTVLTKLGYGANKDLARLYVEMMQLHHNVTKANVGRFHHLDKCVEISVYDSESVFEILFWENHGWSTIGTEPTIRSFYYDLDLAREHFALYITTLLGQATRDAVLSYARDNSQ